MDVTLLTGFGGEEEYVNALLAVYEPRIPDAAEFAVANRVLLLKTDEGTGIDIALAGLPFEEQAVDRADDVEFGKGVKLDGVLGFAGEVFLFTGIASEVVELVGLEGGLVGLTGAREAAAEAG